MKHAILDERSVNRGCETGVEAPIRSRKPLAMPESVHPLPNQEQIGLQAQIKKTKPRLHPSSAASSSIPPTGAAGERPGTAPGSQFSRGAKEDVTWKYADTASITLDGIGADR